jgi:hypothetical protein
MSPEHMIHLLRNPSFELTALQVNEMKQALSERNIATSPRSLFNYGDVVMFKSPAHGIVEGRVEKFGPKNVFVTVAPGACPSRPNGGRWRMHPSYLRLKNPRPTKEVTVAAMGLPPASVESRSAPPSNGGHW